MYKTSCIYGTLWLTNELRVRPARVLGRVMSFSLLCMYPFGLRAILSRAKKSCDDWTNSAAIPWRDGSLRIFLIFVAPNQISFGITRVGTDQVLQSGRVRSQLSPAAQWGEA